MYRIKITGYVQYLELSDSLHDREYGKDFRHFKYMTLFRDSSILERNFTTEQDARSAMRNSYLGVDDYGLGLTWTVVRRGSIVVTGEEAIDYAERNGEALFVSGDLGDSDWEADFERAREICQHSPNRVYTTADPLRLSEYISVNPTKAGVVVQRQRGEASVSLYSAPGLGEDAENWWYFLESEDKPEVVDPENPDPKAAAALHMSQEELRQILAFHLRENSEEQGSTERLRI
jgi:hypothetical protein